MSMERSIRRLYFVATLLTYTLLTQQGVQGARDKRSEYYGRLIGNFNSYAHRVGGKVYAVDEDTVFIKGFTYDGLGPDAYFWMGKTSQPSPTGVIVPYPVEYSGEKREPPVLKNYDNQDVLLHLPDGYKIKDFKWLSIWCRRFTVNFGDVYIPNELVPPARRILPEFKRLAHGLRSGNITILDARTFYIPNLHYDGAGPDAYFFVGKGDRPHSAGKKIPNEKGSMEVLQGYEGEDIELTLPTDMTVMDIDWLAVWCVAYKHNFGHVIIPKDLNVPPALGQFKTPERPADDKGFSNCREFLNKKVQVKWNSVGNHIHFQVSARIQEDSYVALGFSPVKGKTQMVGGDAIVIYYTPQERKKFHADDYYMTARSQCDGEHGVCPDSRHSGRNDVVVTDGYRKNGVTTVMFKRPFITSDVNQYDIDLDNEINVMVAIGLLNNRKEANYHYGERTGPDDDERIFLRRRGDHNCLTSLDELQEKNGPQLKPWQPAIIDGVTNFTARIGPTGGKRGYSPITGQPSWGIAWYINDMLIPEIYVERGKTYYFTVEGGNDSKNPSRYHPFYITDSPEGGMGQKNEYKRNEQRVYAGVNYDSMGYAFPTAAGRYCEWQHLSVDKSAESETFVEYMKTLHLVCDDGNPAVLEWTVDVNTPDLVYYQCYTHNNLGWKINVNDAGFRLRRTAPNGGPSTRTTSVLNFSFVISLISSAIASSLWLSSSV